MSRKKKEITSRKELANMGHETSGERERTGKNKERVKRNTRGQAVDWKFWTSAKTKRADRKLNRSKKNTQKMQDKRRLMNCGKNWHLTWKNDILNKWGKEVQEKGPSLEEEASPTGLKTR